MQRPFELFDKDQELKMRLKRLPRLWFDPLQRYSRKQKVKGDGADGAVLGRRRDGRIERVRWADGNETRKLLLAEYEALRTASHTYLARLCWAGVQGMRLFVATTWIDGKDREEWPVPLPALLRRMECAARGVAALHEKGLVHGDLKPATILSAGDGALVIDFKFAAPAGKREETSYSPKFASPEQILEENVGPEADVYALGVTLYSLFIRDRFPTLLKPESSDEDEGKSEVLSPETMITAPMISAPVKREAGADRAEGAIVGAKVLFRSRFAGVMEGCADAGLIGPTLKVVQRACNLDPKKRYPNAGSLADAFHEIGGNNSSSR